ncbi:MAG: formylglycine-generating enzyme family protein [Candidatus Competibacteraceae bacterium]|nr:formylglycine-generating enzyme family protein [Candidatus Competibacteraceae bacterium]
MIHTDREHLTFCRLTKPAWASAIGRDRFGLWCEIAVEPKQGGEPVIQRLRWIPPGRFWMGSPKEEQGHFDWEGPRHLVTLSEGYWLFDTPCTQALWEAVMGENPSNFKGGDRPVERIRWNDAQDFLKRINEQNPGLNLSLPSEAQWEYACRAGTETAIYTKDLDAIAWYSGNSKDETHPVKLKRANPWGLYDMLGNVLEWVQDHWHNNYQDAPTDGSAWEDRAPGASRVLRGGSWNDGARHVRAASRFGNAPGSRYAYFGFRCVRVRGEPSQPVDQKSDAGGAGVAPSGAPGRQGDESRSGFGRTVRDLWKRFRGS